MKLIDADKFLSYLIFSKHIDSLTCGEVKEAVEMCKVDIEPQEPCEDATLKDIFCMGCEYKEQEPCDDLISREETLTAFADYIGSGMSMNDYDALYNIVEKMPPARPQKPASKKSLQAHSVECNKYL